MSDDLLAVRDFMNDRVAVGPSPRLRQRVLNGTVPPRRSAYRWAVPIAAAFVALATLAGVGLALHRADDAAAPGELIRGPRLDAAAALAELERAAMRTAPVTVPAGSYLYQRLDHLDPGAGTVELWSEPQGMITVKIREGGKDFESRPSRAEIVDSLRGEFARSGPSFQLPTADWLAGLPADPDKLLTELRRTASTLDEPWTVCASLFFRIDPLLPPAVRAGLLKIMGGAAGLSASEVTIGGKRRVALRSSARDTGSEVFFDPATAHAVGSATVDQRPSPGTVPSAAPQPDSQQLWTFNVVSSLPS